MALSDFTSPRLASAWDGIKIFPVGGSKEQPKQRIGLKWPQMKIDSAITENQQITWPYVYPFYYKISIQPGYRRIRLSQGPATSAFTFGAAFEFLWEQVVYYGLAYDFNYIQKNALFQSATIHRFALNTGFIWQLDDDERHHLLFHFRPVFSMLRTEKGNVSKPGVGLGFGYEFALNSDYLLSPDIMYYRFPTLDKYPYGLSGFAFGLRLIFGK